MIPHLYTSPSGHYRRFTWLGLAVGFWYGQFDHLTFLRWEIKA
jgi:hypothetical protein